MKPYYQDDACTIFHGDCREILPTLGRFDLLLTDPPYGVRLKSGWGGKHMKCEIANDACTKTRDEALRFHDGPAVVFGSWKQPKPAGTHTVLVWDKGGHCGMGDLSIPWKPNWEEIYVIGRGFEGSRDSSVMSWHTNPTFSANRTHPTEKPVGLIKMILGKCLLMKSIVDPFCGTGASLVAAKSEGFHAVGIELEERYCEIAARRLSQGVLF